MRPINLSARHYATGQPIDVAVAAGRIASIAPAAHASAAAIPWVAPAFVDLQVNGYLGREFGDPNLTVDDVEQISRALDAHGCVGYAPTVTTNSFDILHHALATLRRACDERAEVARRVVGFHLEGPYISPEDGPRGAHPLAHARPPDWDEFRRLNDAAGGRIRILTMSPEYDNAPRFIERTVAAGVVVAIGHTAADSAQIKAAVYAGARFSTHLGNGAHGQLRRHPNYIWDQLAEDRLWASLIVDGHHLPPTVVQSFVRAKTPDRCLLVSDITGMAGMPPGNYPDTSLGHIEILEDGRHVVGGQRQFLAGASQPIGVGVANVMRFAGVDLRAAIDMASLRAAQLIGIEPHRLEVGALANLVVFRLNDTRDALCIESTINAGEVVFSADALSPATSGDC
jgi:N-acetylglucosamine-6-phosphate deacetylase